MFWFTPNKELTIRYVDIFPRLVGIRSTDESYHYQNLHHSILYKHKWHPNRMPLVINIDSRFVIG